MKFFHKKNLFLFSLCIVLLLCMAITLASCKKDEEPPEDEITVESGDQPDTDAVSPQLSVTYDPTLVCYADSIEDIGKELTVEIVSGEARRKVEFTVQSSEVSEDGGTVVLVISAEGLEQTIRLPYVVAEVSRIRDELMPLYELLGEAGDRSFCIGISYGSLSDEAGVPSAYDFDVMVNRFENGDRQIALIRQTEDASKAVAVYRDGTLSIGGTDAGTEKTASIVEIFESVFGLSEGEDSAASALLEDSDSRKALFVALSAILNGTDRIFDNPVAKNMNLDFSVDNGVYSLQINSKKLIALIDLVAPDEGEGAFNLDGLIDLIDGQTDGALRKGKIKFHLSFAVKDDGLKIAVKVQNDETKGYFDFAVSLDVAEQAYEMPETSDALDLDVAEENGLESFRAVIAEAIQAMLEDTATDLEICLPIAFPQKNVELTTKAVLHLSHLLESDLGDIATLTVFYNDREEPIVRFVLHDAYLYLDMNGLSALLAQENTDPAPAAFYQAFEIDGEPATFREVLIDRIRSRIFQTDLPDDEMTEDDSSESPFPYGYGVSYKEDFEPFFEIGATEDDLREILFVYICDENDNEIEYTDYQIVGFDGSRSYSGEVAIVLAEGYEIYIDVVIRDPDNVSEKRVTVDAKLLLKKGTSYAEAESYVGAEVILTDGVAEWSVWVNDFEFAWIVGPDGAPVTAGNNFDKVGNYLISVTRTSTEVSYLINGYVYDPENLIPLEIYCPNTVNLPRNGVTEEAIREQIYVAVVYDDGSETGVEDYEIEFVENNETGFYVQWGELEKSWVAIYYYVDDAEDFAVTDYLRFYGSDDETSEQTLFNLIALFLTHRAELKDFITVGDATVHIVVNSESDQDLLAFLNHFVGIPNGDEWTDIDAENLMDLISGQVEEKFEEMLDIEQVFRNLTGVELADVLADLCVDASVVSDDGSVTGTIVFGDNDATEYFSAGLTAGFVDASADVVLTDAEISAARSFEDLSGTALAFLMQIFLKLAM